MSCLSLPRYLFLLTVLLLTSVCSAHEIRPAIADIQLNSNGEVSINIEANLESLIAKIDPKHNNTDDSKNAPEYNRLRALSPAMLATEYQSFAEEFASGVSVLFDDKRVALSSKNVDIPEIGDIRLSRSSMIHLSGTIPRQAEQVSFEYAPKFGNVAVKFRHNDEQAQAVHWLVDGKRSPAFSLNSEYVPQSWSKVALNYMILGFEHIVPKGLDHILFVLGIFLLSTQLGPLLAQVTTFTLAHSITLGLSIYGVVSLSPLIVEPLIALSIVYIGIENIFRGKNSLSRLILIFGFGLLHGLGFAGVLSEIGLPKSDYLTALITFNVGVEFGQLAVISAAFLLVVLLRLKGHPNYRKWVVIPGSTLISIVGFYWLIERVGLI